MYSTEYGKRCSMYDDDKDYETWTKESDRQKDLVEETEELFPTEVDRSGEGYCKELHGVEKDINVKEPTKYELRMRNKQLLQDWLNKGNKITQIEEGRSGLKTRHKASR